MKAILARRTNHIAHLAAKAIAEGTGEEAYAGAARAHCYTFRFRKKHLVSDHRGTARSLYGAFLSVLLGSEPSRTVIAVAAFAGLRRGEIEGLLWESYDGESYRAFQNTPKSPSVSQRNMSLFSARHARSKSSILVHGILPPCVPLVVPLVASIDATVDFATGAAGHHEDLESNSGIFTNPHILGKRSILKPSC